MTPRARIEVYAAADGWRWRAKAGNYRIVGASEEAHERFPYTVGKARAQFPDLPVLVLDDPAGIRHWLLT